MMHFITKKTRATNSIVSVYQMEENDNAIAKWMVHCDSHDVKTYYRTLRMARTFMFIPWQFCDSCRDLFLQCLELDGKILTGYSVKCNKCSITHSNYTNDKSLSIKLGLENGYVWKENKFYCKMCAG